MTQRIAIVQQAAGLPRPRRHAGSAPWRRCDEAAQDGAQLVVFPEAFMPGYPAWIWRLRPGGDIALTEQLHARLRANAVDLGRRRPRAAARGGHAARSVTVVCGMHERDGEFSRGTLYNTVVVIGPDGALLNRHRKLMPTNPERMVWGFGDATGLKVVDTPCGRVGALICWESYMPLARCALYAQGVEIYVAPTYDSGARWLATMQHIAREGGCWVLGSGCAFQARDMPDALPGKARAVSRRRRVGQRRRFGGRRAGRQDRRRPAARGAGHPVRRHRTPLRRCAAGASRAVALARRWAGRRHAELGQARGDAVRRRGTHVPRALPRGAGDEDGAGDAALAASRSSMSAPRTAASRASTSPSRWGRPGCSCG